MNLLIQTIAWAMLAIGCGSVIWKSFNMLSTRSTLENVGGLFLLIIVFVGIIFFIKSNFSQTKQNKNES